MRKSVAGLSEAALSRFVTRAVRATGLCGGVNVLVTTSRELRSLNWRFRGKDQPTDVLSFPTDPTLPARLAGDIAISADIAAHNSKRLGHSAAEEVKVLVLHGVLHLAGYDHVRDNGSMARKEMRLRTALGLPIGLIERSEDSGAATRGSIRDKAQANTSRSKPGRTKRRLQGEGLSHLAVRRTAR